MYSINRQRSTDSANMSDHEEVVMTPLLAPEGMTVLKVERVSRGLLDPRTVHYVAGGRYKGIIINRAANEKPDYRSPGARRSFTCYISKLKGEPMREQRQLRFWFRHGSSDMDPMADRFFKELINPHLFPRDYIGYVKRILQLLQGYPTVAKMELEMRPARPDEEDQQYVVRRMGRGRSQPPPGVGQDDYHTWHAPHARGGARGELQPGTPVDFRGPVDSYRVYTSSPRTDRKGRDHDPTDLNALLQSMLAQGVTQYDYGHETSSGDSSPAPSRHGLRPASEILLPRDRRPYHGGDDSFDDVTSPRSQSELRMSLTSDPVTSFSDDSSPRHSRQRSIKVLKLGTSSTHTPPPTTHTTPLDISVHSRTAPVEGVKTSSSPEVNESSSPRESPTKETCSAFMSVEGPRDTEPESEQISEMPQPEEDIVPEVVPEVSEAPRYDVRTEPPDKALKEASPELNLTDIERDATDDVKADVIPEQDAVNDLDDVINELAEQYQLTDIDDGAKEAQTEHVEYFIVAPSRVSFRASASRSLDEAYRRAKRKKAMSYIDNLVRSGVSITVDRRKVTSLADLENQELDVNMEDDIVFAVADTSF